MLCKNDQGDLLQNHTSAPNQNANMGVTNADYDNFSSYIPSISLSISYFFFNLQETLKFYTM